jgi:hypothetical protein
MKLFENCEQIARLKKKIEELGEIYTCILTLYNIQMLTSRYLYKFIGGPLGP